MPRSTNEDIAVLIEQIARAEESLDATEKAHAEATAHWINRIHPVRRRNLRRVELDVFRGRAALKISKDVVANYLRRNPES